MHLRQFGFRAVLIAVSLPLLLSACGHASQAVAPSALASDPPTYDGQDVTVTGTVKNPMTRHFRRGSATIYELCDSTCIHVVQFGATNVSEGTSLTVSGRFHASFGRRTVFSNVLVVGGRRRGPEGPGGQGGPGGGMPSPT